MTGRKYHPASGLELREQSGLPLPGMDMPMRDSAGNECYREHADDLPGWSRARGALLAAKRALLEAGAAVEALRALEEWRHLSGALEPVEQAARGSGEGLEAMVAMLGVLVEHGAEC